MSRKWVVRGDEATVAGVLAELGAAAEAIDEGRVFLGRRRITSPDTRVRSGDEIVVHDPPERVDAVRVISEWRGLVAVSKPAGLSTEADRRGGASVVRAAADVLGVPVRDLHAATRLDRQVSGVVVLARGEEGKRFVAGLQRDGALRRRYVALARGTLGRDAGTFDAPVGRDGRGRPAVGGRDARPARTCFRVAAQAGLPDAPVLLVSVEIGTGRTHQIRLHFAAAGAPLIGDAEHGGTRRLILAGGAVLGAPRVMLHAARASVPPGEGREAWQATAPIPEDFATLFTGAGGRRAALERAVVDALSDAAAPS